MEKLYKPTWAEINLDHLEHNYRELHKLSKGSRINGVVKANAYGHGSKMIARELERLGVRHFCVANLFEGLELRRAGIQSAILVLGYIPREGYEIAIDNDIEATIYNVTSAEIFDRLARERNIKYKIHIKLDTGMRRLGFQINEKSKRDIIQIARMKNLFLEGIFTHFASSDAPDNSFTVLQYNLFDMVVRELETEGVYFDYKHVDNDAALLSYGYRGDMVRLGIGLYGQYPSSFVRGKTDLELKPVMSLFSSITHIKTIEKGNTVSYGQTFTAKRTMKIATVAIGYADGYPRILSNKAYVLIRGKRAKIVGRICMDQLMVDITKIPEAELEDRVTLFGVDQDEEIEVDELAELCNTISYEILSDINRRVPRVFKKNNKIIEVVDYLNIG